MAVVSKRGLFQLNFLIELWKTIKILYLMLRLKMVAIEITTSIEFYWNKFVFIEFNQSVGAGN